MKKKITHAWLCVNSKGIFSVLTYGHILLGFIDVNDFLLWLESTLIRSICCRSLNIATYNDNNKTYISTLPKSSENSSSVAGQNKNILQI